MMDKNELKARITELSAQIEERSVEREKLKHQLAEMQTTFKVGDRVTFAGAKYVWELTAICPGYGDEPKYFGARIKKNGMPGVRISEIWQVPYEKELVLVNAKVSNTNRSPLE